MKATYRTSRAAVEHRIAIKIQIAFEKTQKWLENHPKLTGGVDVDTISIFQTTDLDDLIRHIEWISTKEINTICRHAVQNVYQQARWNGNKEMETWAINYLNENK
jgi:hypothetical protein